MKTLAVLTLTALIAAPAVRRSNPSSATANAPAAASAAGEGEGSLARKPRKSI
jgi:hypothetical protein